MKALAVIAAVLVGLYLIGSNSDPAATAPAAPEVVGKVELVSLTCKTNSVGTRGVGSIRNIGTVPIKYPDVFIRYGDGSVQRSIAQPMTLNPGAISSFNVSGPPGTAACSLYAVQDDRGNSVL